MAAVNIGTLGSPATISGRRGPYEDGNKYLWVVGITTGYKLRVAGSTDSGETWPLTYDSAILSGASAPLALDSVYDSENGVIYVLVVPSTLALQVWSFTISTHTWVQVDGSTNRPSTIQSLPTGQYPVFIVRKSNGDFRIAYMANKSAMGTPYRNVYYAPLTAAGVWGSAVLVSAGTKLYNYDLKGAVLGASDRTHFMFVHADTGELSHRTLTSANAFGTRATVFGSGTAENYYGLVYNATLGKLVAGTSNAGSDRVGRADSVDSPGNFTTDTYPAGFGEPSSSPAAFAYDPISTRLYVFYRDRGSDDLFYAFTEDTIWRTAFQFDHNDSGLPIYGGSGISYEQAGQSFVADKTETITKVYIYLVKTGSPGTLSMDIRSGSFGGSVIGTTSFTPSDNEWTEVVISASLTAGTTYYIVLYPETQDINNYWNWKGAPSDYYSLGNAAHRDSGVWQNSLGTDLAFEIQKGAGRLFDTTTAVAGINVNLITNAIGIVFNDSGVYFDKLVLTTPIPPVTANEEFFSLL